MTNYSRIKRQKPFLDALLNAHSQPRKREQYLQHANKDQINSISEIVLNTLKNNIEIDPPLMARLRRYKEPLRTIGKRKNSLQRRRQELLKQKGKGFWLGLRDICKNCRL